MSKNIVIAGGIIGVALIAGGAYFAFSGSDSATTNNSNTSSQTQTTVEEADASAFSPKNTLEQDFKATINIEGGDLASTSTAEYDSASKTWRYASNVNGIDSEFIITEDAYYTLMDGTWIKLPASGGVEDTGFDRSAYELTPEELSTFQEILTYKGSASCPAGTCDVWEADNYEGNDKLTFYVAKDTNTISQMVSETQDGKTTITYNYEDVTITVPTDAQELPTFGQ